MTTVVYSLVAKAGSVFADYTAPVAYAGISSQFNVNFDAVARSHLSTIPKENCSGNSCILGHYFYHNVCDGLVLLCVTDSKEDADLPRRFLIELRSLCSPQVINNTSQRSELLTRILSRLVNDYNNTSDKLKSIETSLDHTNQTLRGSISSILERGELIDSIVAKSHNLKDETLAFRTAAHKANSNIFVRVLLGLSECVGNRELVIGISVTALIGIFLFFAIL